LRGASDATYLINAFGEELLMQLQLNGHRLVVVYRVPALDALDASTLAIVSNAGASAHAGWKFGWRDSAVAGDPSRRLSKHIAMPSPAITFSKTRATLLAQRRCADDPLLHDRGSPQRHSHQC
jgi:hypothetical protein